MNAGVVAMRVWFGSVDVDQFRLPVICDRIRLSLINIKTRHILRQTLNLLLLITYCGVYLTSVVWLIQMVSWADFAMSTKLLGFVEALAVLIDVPSVHHLLLLLLQLLLLFGLISKILNFVLDRGHRWVIVIVVILMLDLCFGWIPFIVSNKGIKIDMGWATHRDIWLGAIRRVVESFLDRDVLDRQLVRIPVGTISLSVWDDLVCVSSPGPGLDINVLRMM